MTQPQQSSIKVNHPMRHHHTASSVPSTNGRVQSGDDFTPQELARRARLRYVGDSEAGFQRRRCGRGFIYLDASGRRLTQSRHLERIRSLAIPPAWTEVWICRYATGHLQATGRDSRGRKQYRYHDRWQQMTGRVKFSALAAFGLSLPRLRRQVAKDLDREGLPWEKVAALSVALLDATGIRVGNREYATDNETYGLTTLQNRHAKVAGSQVVLSFKGKGGQRLRLKLENPRLAELIAECRAIRGDTLLQYESEHGRQPLTSHDVNEYLAGVLNDAGMTAKTFRTWHGSKIVAERLYHAEPNLSRSARKKLVSQTIREAAKHLGNTPTICQKYYIHPRIIELFLEKQYPQVFADFTPRRKKRTTKAEQILLRILEHNTEELEAV